MTEQIYVTNILHSCAMTKNVNKWVNNQHTVDTEQ